MSDQTYTKADLDAAIAEAKAGLESKRDELLDEVKKLKADLRRTAEIKPEDLAAAEDRADKAEAALKEAQRAVTALTKERDTAVKALESEQGFTQKLLVENGLTEALTAAGVKEAPHLKAVKAMLAPLVQIAADGDQRIAKVGDKALLDHVKEWAASDEGKFFVSAPNNSGGGAPGGKGGATGKTVSEAEFNSMGAKERVAFFDGGGQIAA